jgi:hypothetical protein
MRDESKNRKILNLLAMALLIDAGFAKAGPLTVAAASEAGPTVRVEASCEAVAPAYCQGHFGFTVGGDGVWRVGPRPDGRVLSGRLSPAEAQRLRDAARALLRAAEREMPACPVLGAIPGVGERVTVSERDRGVVLNGAGGELDPSCSPHRSEYALLFALGDRLMRRYYPRPFKQFPSIQSSRTRSP